MFSQPQLQRAHQLLEAMRTRRLMLATAESCTGGLIAALITSIPGSSDVLDRGFVTYSNTAKMQMLAVPQDVLEAHGAVSDETARAMAEGALANSAAQLSVSVTGVAGPGGGTDLKPVGLVHFGASLADGATLSEKRLFGDIGRDAVREQSVTVALELAMRALA